MNSSKSLIDRLNTEIPLTTDGEYIVLSKAIDIIRQHTSSDHIAAPGKMVSSEISVVNKYDTLEWQIMACAREFRESDATPKEVGDALMEVIRRHYPIKPVSGELRQFLRDLSRVDDEGRRIGLDMSWKEIARRASEELCKIN